eukprot:4364573-Amphidinium_carterae.1
MAVATATLPASAACNSSVIRVHAQTLTLQCEDCFWIRNTHAHGEFWFWNKELKIKVPCCARANAVIVEITVSIQGC